MEKKKINVGKKFIDFSAFIVLLLTSVFIIIQNVFPVFGLDVKGKLFQILDFIKNVLFLLVIGASAFGFAREKKSAQTVFWIAIVVYVVASFFGVF